MGRKASVVNGRAIVLATSTVAVATSSTRAFVTSVTGRTGTGTTLGPATDVRPFAAVTAFVSGFVYAVTFTFAVAASAVPSHGTVAGLYAYVLQSICQGGSHRSSKQNNEIVRFNDLTPISYRAKDGKPFPLLTKKRQTSLEMAKWCRFAR